MNHCCCHSKDTLHSNLKTKNISQDLKLLTDLNELKEGAKYPLLTCKNNDSEFTFLIDTGADVSIINKGSLSQISHTEGEGKVHIMTGSTSVVASNCNIKLSTKHFSSTEEFRVLDIGSQCFTLSTMAGTIIHGVLGMSFLIKNNLILDFKNNKIYQA